MTRLFTINQTPATCAVAMYLLKTRLRNAGWTVPRASDGSTYNSSGDQITHGGSGAAGMDNAKAWFVIQMPGASGRQFCLQRQTTTGANTSYRWRVKYSKGAGFSGGSPSATVTPSATDEQVLLGAGTDAAPSFDALFQIATDGLLRFNCMADNASPYGFLAWAWGNTTGNTALAFGLEPLASYNTADTEPYLVHLEAVSTTVNYSWFRSQLLYSTYTQIGGWHDGVFYKPCANTYPLLAAADIHFYPPGSSPHSMWGNAGTNLDGYDDVLPIFVGRWTNIAPPNCWWKGVMTFTKALAQTGRVTGDLATVSSARDGVVVGQCILPWDGYSTPLV